MGRTSVPHRHRQYGRLWPQPARRVIALALLGSLLLHALLLWGLPVGKAGGGGGANDGRAEQGRLAVRLRTTVTPRRQPAPLPAQPTPPRPAPKVKAPPVLLTDQAHFALPSKPSPSADANPSPPMPVVQPASSPVLSAQDVSTPPAEAAALAAAGDGQSAWLGLDVYYAAREVDVVAREQQPIDVSVTNASPDERTSVMLKVYINEQGYVDAVQLISATPAGAEQVPMERFRQARFFPAVRQGRLVKSFKIIQIGWLD